MEDKDFRELYKKEFDRICASESLKTAVKNINPRSRRHIVTPFKATIGTVAAAIMIFAAVHDYSFNNDTSGVISETVVSTPLPEAQFEIVEKKTEPVKPTQKQKTSIAVAVTAAPVTEPEPVPVITEAPAAEAPAEEFEPAAFASGGPAPRNVGGEYIPPTVEKWTVSKYYEYLGTDISQAIGCTYTGTAELEFETGQDGIPLDDTAVLNFVSATGATIRITVSRHVLFDAALSGNISEAGNGYNAYKLSNGVYYNLYITNATHTEAASIVNML